MHQMFSLFYASDFFDLNIYPSHFIAVLNSSFSFSLLYDVSSNAISSFYFFFFYLPVNPIQLSQIRRNLISFGLSQCLYNLIKESVDFPP